MGEGEGECSVYTFDPSVFTKTASTEFNIACDLAYLQTLSGVLRMSGLLVGSFVFGWMSDILGRVPSLTVAGLVLVLAQGVNIFSTNYLMYSLMNMISSAGGIGIFLIGFVYIFEWTAPRYRTKISVLDQVPFCTGFLWVVGVSYFIRSWRTLQFVFVLPNFLLLAYKFILPESPRWLATKGLQEEALNSLRFAAKLNKRKLPINLELSDISSSSESSDPSSPASGETSALKETPPSTEVENLNLGTIVVEWFLLSRLIILSMNWVVITLCFYGLSLNSARDENIFASVAAMAGVEFPGYVLCMFIMEGWGRRPVLSLCQIVAGTFCVSAGFLPDSMGGLQLVLGLVGKMGASAGYAVVYVYTAELFPTKLRNSAVGLCSTLARFGGLLAPVIADLGAVYTPLPYLVMGGSSILVGALAFLLPETRGKPLPQTLKEARSQ
ncbi:organic cation transporter protein isoform X2 [Eurytemora carolleeae]|nr:organic cation transporter protein isoform X2 [Eurytemora carolleeae]|eukprot:XP_023349296.1 organic cation transporter protein-like isoform X2 [Eurytemora affinis]